MTALDSQPLVRLPMCKLSAWLLAAPGAIVVAALAIALVLGGDLWRARLEAASWGGVALYTGIVSGLGFLGLFGPRAVFSWGALVIAGSMIRVAASLSVAAGLYILVRPERTFFWTIVLVASLVALALETAIVRHSLGAAPGLPHPVPQSEPRAA